MNGQGFAAAAWEIQGERATLRDAWRGASVEWALESAAFLDADGQATAAAGPWVALVGAASRGERSRSQLQFKCAFAGNILIFAVNLFAVTFWLVMFFVPNYVYSSDKFQSESVRKKCRLVYIRFCASLATPRPLLGGEGPSADVLAPTRPDSSLFSPPSTQT